MPNSQKLLPFYVTVHTAKFVDFARNSIRYGCLFILESHALCTYSVNKATLMYLICSKVDSLSVNVWSVVLMVLTEVLRIIFDS